MSNGNYYVNQRLFIFIIGFLLLFLLYNFDPFLGNSFLTMFLVSGILYIWDELKGNKVQFRFESKNIFKSLFLALAGLVVLYFVIFGITNASIFELQSEYRPYFEGSKLFSWVGTGVLIPIVETFAFFGIAFELGLDALKVPTSLSLSNPKLLIWLGIIAILFLFFHITAKLLSINSTNALISVGAFALISMVLVVLEKSILGATILHITANSISILTGYGFTALWIAGATAAPIILLLYLTQPNFKIQNIFSGVSRL